ncbi:hypothetical protein [Sporosarcina sp. NPDC096371]|uniref:hypothetical protein n=1 Tax=Sporosarcina sp. NPDC096371 TaxID=3364530 RepID=UPI003801E78C
MRCIKYSSNCRYFFSNDVITFITKERKFTIKASESEYLAIHRMLGEMHEGVEEQGFRERNERYDKIIRLLEKVGVIYTIDADKLREHQQSTYFQVVEMKASNVEETLDKIKEVKFVINADFMAKNEFAMLLQENHLSYQIMETDQGDDIQLICDNHHEFVNSSLNDYKEIIIAALTRNSLGHLNKGQVSPRQISPALLATFMFYSSIDKIAAEKNHVFIINDELEVKRKELFCYQDKESKGLEVTSIDVAGMDKEGIFDSLNTLELFVEKYSSKIISFNKDERYGDYSQLPLQVFTIQHYDANDRLDNMYFADFSYERLSSFIVEIGFNEIMKRSYGDAANTVMSEEKTIIQMYDIPEYESVLELMDGRGLELDVKVEMDAESQYFIHIQDYSSDKTFTFDMPIPNEKYIPLVINTFISAKENNVEPRVASFSELTNGSTHDSEKENQLEEMKL